MPIRFKAVEKGQPGVVGGGVKQFYPSPVYTNELTIEELTREVEKISTISGADIRGVLYAAVDVIADKMSDGQIVRLGDLGSFRVSLSGTPSPTADAVSASNVKSTKILFTPGPKLKAMLKSAKFAKSSK